jgi:hypothetical protein
LAERTQADEYEEIIPFPIACQREMSFTGYGKRAIEDGEGVFKSIASAMHHQGPAPVLCLLYAPCFMPRPRFVCHFACAVVQYKDKNTESKSARGPCAQRQLANIETK